MLGRLPGGLGLFRVAASADFDEAQPISTRFPSRAFGGVYFQQRDSIVDQSRG